MARDIISIQPPHLSCPSHHPIPPIPPLHPRPHAGSRAPPNNADRDHERGRGAVIFAPIATRQAHLGPRMLPACASKWSMNRIRVPHLPMAQIFDLDSAP
eukprot:5094806-Pyramimonas_sp.AAC.1